MIRSLGRFLVLFLAPIMVGAALAHLLDVPSILGAVLGAIWGWGLALILWEQLP